MQLAFFELLHLKAANVGIQLVVYSGKEFWFCFFPPCSLKSVSSF